jgi:hypothetical protein
MLNTSKGKKSTKSQAPPEVSGPNKNKFQNPKKLNNKNSNFEFIIF